MKILVDNSHNTYFYLTVLTLIAFLFINACKPIDTPQLVKDAFNEKFKEVNEIEDWKREKDLWQVSFLMEDRHYFVEFKEDGGWVQTNKSLYFSEIPTSIIDSLNIQYKEFILSEIYHSFTLEDNFYRINLIKDGSEVEIYMNEDGVLINNL